MLLFLFYAVWWHISSPPTEIDILECLREDFCKFPRLEDIDKIESSMFGKKVTV